MAQRVMGRGVTTIDVLSFTVHGSCDGFSGHAFRLSPQPSLSSLPPLSCPSFPRPLLIAFHDLTWVFHSAAEMTHCIMIITVLNYSWCNTDDWGGRRESRGGTWTRCRGGGGWSRPSCR
mmetsp:Transcript_31620/g.68349  ORF Transcript_31620/g.68349 Transcript_31620/m.68349 type:complete len:119 (-) Transcript_31620:47-403(-)